VNGQKANLPSRILSGGDEKVLRLFEAPFSFVKTFNLLNPDAKTLELKYNENKSNEEVEKLISSEAQKQPLGLMNKPVVFLANDKMRVDDEAEGGAGIDFDPTKILSNVKGAADELIEELSEPPLEDILMSKTLWPEL
jgi:elongator complex protein 2